MLKEKMAKVKDRFYESIESKPYGIQKVSKKNILVGLELFKKFDTICATELEAEL